MKEKLSLLSFVLNTVVYALEYFFPPLHIILSHLSSFSLSKLLTVLSGVSPSALLRYALPDLGSVSDFIMRKKTNNGPPLADLGSVREVGPSANATVGPSQLSFVSLEGAARATRVKVDGGLGYIR